MLSCKFNFDIKQLDKESDEVIARIGTAVFSAALEMKDRARQHMLSSSYHLDSVVDGIVVGTLKTSKGKKDPTVKLHAFGNRGKGHLARIFVGGTVQRTTRKGYQRGYVRPTNSIDEAIDQSILDKKIQEALDK